MKNKQKMIKILAVAIVVLIGIIALITKVYSDNNNHFVVDVVKTSAINEDDNLKITEKIVKENGQQYYDAENLNYEVEIANKNGENNSSQVALVVDTSYSMTNNNAMDVAKEEAKALAQGIFSNVKSVQMSLVSNSGLKVAQTTNSTTIINTINGLTSGESADCNDGLVAAYNSFGTPAAGKTLNKVIIYFTDSTDSVSDKMKEIMTLDPTLKIISVLVDLTSSSYLNLSTGDAVAGEVYVLPNSVDAQDIVPNNVQIYDAQYIYDELNFAANNIKVANTFSSTITDCFTITDVTAQTGTVNTTVDENNKIIGYEWSIDKLKFQETAKMTFTIKFKKDAVVDAGAIFNDTYTNKKQEITYNKFNTSVVTTMDGTDAREGTESTVIKICQGYDLNIKAISESNSELPVEGVQITIIGENEAGEEVCNFTKTTDEKGYITITAEEAQSLRGDGIITYTLTADNAESLLGYEKTDAMVFAIDNNKVTRKLIFNDMGCNITNYINETTRSVEVQMPISCTKIDFEIRATELNNSSIILSDCEFELIQPKLNNKYEMSVLSGKTDANGVLHLNPTVMTKDGTYNYILRQVSAPTSYDVTGLALISITFKNGRIIADDLSTNEIKTMYNENVTAYLDTASASAKTDHIIVGVQNISQQGSAFDLQINVSDVEDNDIKLNGVTYLITTTNSFGQVRKEYATTDAKGQINTQVLGTGFLTIKIQEVTAKVGYTEDKDVKEILVQRVNNQLTVISANPADKYNTDTYKTKYIKDTAGNPIGLQVDLASQKKEQQNVLKLQLVEKDDPSVNIGEGIIYNLYDSTGKNYGPAISDQDGIVRILLGNQAQGIYTYELRVDTASVPNEYDKTRIDTLITIDAEFDANGYLTNNTHVTSTSSSVIKEEYAIENEYKNLNYTDIITIGYYIDSSFEFSVLLRDKKDLRTALDGAKYNIEIEYISTQNGNTVKRIKKLTNRQTNIAGKISTKIAAADEVIINIQEIEPKIGYTPEKAKQQIVLHRTSSGTMIIDSQGPFDFGATNTAEPNKGASISGNIITYYDYNRGRSAEDNYLNLTVIKQDPTLAYVNGVLVNVKSDDLVDGNDNPLDITIKTGSQATPVKVMDGEIAFDYEEYIKAEPNSYTIRVPGIQFSAANATTPEETVKHMEITEMELIGGKLVEKKATKVKLRLIYRTLGNTIKLTNVETIYGNRLVLQKEFSTSSDSTAGSQLADSLGIYLSNISINLKTNYDDIGNVGIDLKKKGIIDSSDPNNIIYNELVGAEYDVKVVNPDGTVVKRHVTIDNGSTSSSQELEGLILNKGSVIYFTETKAPLGYDRNVYDEVFEVMDIDEAGEITLQQQSSSYSPARVEMKKLVSSINSAGNTKTNYQLEFIDYQVNTFNVTINAVDNISKKVVSGYEFDVKTSMGAQGIAKSGIQTKIGGNPANTTVTYTIEQKKAEKYYILSPDKVKVNVVFDIAGNVDVAATMAGQTDSNYGKTWTIKSLNPTATGELVIDIDVVHYDPLKVKVHTVDSITNQKINTAEYMIQKSIELPGTGKFDLTQNCVPISVGYMMESGTITYTLEQTNISNDYEKAANQEFTVNYASEEIISVNTNAPADKMVVTNFTSSGEIELTVYVEPKVPFKILNKEFFAPNSALMGANFEITEVSSTKADTATTNTMGEATIYVGTFRTSSTELYLVKQTKAANGYATVEDFYVKVDFDDNRKITAATLVDEYGNPVSSNDNIFVTVSFTDNSGNPVDNVNIEVRNYPEFKINIKNVDRRDGITPVAGTTYDVTSYYIDSTGKNKDFMSATGKVTNATGLAVVGLNRTKMGTVVTYIVKEADSAVGYQTLGQDIEILVTFDADGFVSNVELKDPSLADIAKVEMIPGTVGRFEINLEIKNNPLLKIKIHSVDNINHSIPVRDAGYEITGVESSSTVSVSSDTNKANTTLTPRISYSDANGLSISYMDTTLANKEIIYTIKQVRKAVGYEWLGTDIILKVVYDANGAIEDVVVEQNLVGTVLYGELKSFDSENFIIELFTYHEEIKQFGISLVAEDTYDSTKRINDLTVEAWLAEPSSYGTVPDSQYAFTGADSLKTGMIWSETGGVTSYSPGGQIGETYKPMVEYQPGSTAEGYRETRVLRLVVKNDSMSTRDSGYYLDSDDGSKSGKELGYYQGTTYVDNSRYETVKYAFAINVTFDEEGKIVDTAIRTGLDTYIGWQVDGRYLEVDHTNYTIKIKMKFFPMLKLTAQAVDNFMDFSTLGLTGAKYTVSTSRHDRMQAFRDEYVRAGYIGYGEYYSKNNLVDGHRYEDANTLYVPIENNYTRQFYIFEDSEPTNYQQHRDRRGAGSYYYDQQLIAIVSIVFNEKGEIDYDHSISRYLKDSSGNWTGTFIPIFMAEDGITYLPSDQNVKDYNYDYTKYDSKSTTEVKIGYALTTSIEVTAVDDISGSPITNIKMYPFVNDTYKTNTSYLYNIINYRTTNSKGVTDWKYWGAAVPDTTDRYIIGSARSNSDYNGYLFPDDMASSILGGSGNAEDYYAKLDVSYDSNGRITQVKSIGSDLWGDDNVKSDITWDSKTGKIYIKMIYSRKFQVKLNKIDFYDKTISLKASFNVVSNKGLTTKISSDDKMVCFGKIYKDTTVKYSLSETLIPNGYYPIDGDIDYYVTFDSNGDINTSSVKSNNEYFGSVTTSAKTEAVNKTSPDLTLNIKNKPAFYLDLRVIDKFYKTVGLGDVYLEITNSKGDRAVGNPQTDKNGYANTIIASPVYLGETVTYYIKQLNTVAGYYPNDTIVELEVEFNNNGKINSYRIVNGGNVVNNFNGTAYMGTKKIALEIMNMPKDVKFGLYKYDQLTNLPIDNVNFSVTKTDMNSGATSEAIASTATDIDGKIFTIVDTFTESANGKTIKYTIKELNVPDSYRKTEDIELIVVYRPDGSISNYRQLIDPTSIMSNKVGIGVAANGFVQTFNGQMSHINVNVPNDNTFDLIIKNEDANFPGFGIEGSTFNVDIDGIPYSLSATNVNGETIINNITVSGNLNITVSQATVGEGYRFDLTNVEQIKLNKGSGVYSLTLDSTQNGYVDDKNATTAKAIIQVDEEYGKVYITFKNETKTEIKLIKEDYKTHNRLADAEFEITGQQVNPISGDNIGDPITITTTGNNITNSKGELYFDLGVAPQSQKWIYTFKEVTPPAGYNAIVDTTIVATYDAYGRIKLDPTTSVRMNSLMEHSSDKNCRTMLAIINNGDVAPAYTVKVYKKDVDTNSPINGASISTNITDVETGNPIPVIPVTDASMGNGAIGTTSNVGIDYKTYSDEEVAKKGIPLLASGLVYIDNIDFEGDINIEVIETDTAPGYIIGEQKVNGNVKIKAEYEPQLGGTTNVHFTVVDDDGLNVVVNDTTREISITLYNESQVQFNIHDIVYGTKTMTDPGTPIPGIAYTITSFSGVSPTSLNVTTGLTDSLGFTTADVGKAEPGNFVVYRLHQSVLPAGYQPLSSDIDVMVHFLPNGKIDKVWTIKNGLLNPKLEAVIEGTTSDRVIDLTVMNKLEIPNYKVQVEKYAQDAKTGQYTELLEGATYKVTVNQKTNGVASTTFTEKTDQFGLIDIPGQQFSGTGEIEIILQEIEAPLGYERDMQTKTLVLNRNQDTGNLSEVSADVDYKLINTDSPEYSSGQPVRVILQPKDKQNANRFKLELKKYSTRTNSLIVDNPAKFEATIYQEDDNGNLLYEDYIGEIETNDLGKIKENDLKLPSTPGEYILLLTETEAPVGYSKRNDAIKIALTVEQDEAGYSVITKAEFILKDLEGNEYRSTVDNDIINPLRIDSASQSISLEVGNTKIPGYKVQVEKHVLDTDTDLNAYDRLLPGATYKVKVHEEDAGTEDVTFIETSDENGLIDIPDLVFNGFGYVTITIVELSAPDGYELDNTTYIHRMFRDSQTGNLSEIRSDVNYTFINTDSKDYVWGDPVKVILKPVDKQEEGKYTIILNKYAKTTGEIITAPATFNIKMEELDISGNSINTEEIGTYSTKDGKINLSNLEIPKKSGNYKFTFTEKQAPVGYVKLDKPITVNVTVGQDDEGESIFTSATLAGPNAELISRTQLIALNVGNVRDDEIGEDEYSLDITKVDGVTNTPIQDMALFKVWLPDPNQTAVYAETSQTKKGPGKLDYCYIEEDKDYSVRLTHMRQPTTAGTLEYVFQEIVAPNGYGQFTHKVILTLDFQYDENGTLYLANATSSDPRYLRVNTQTPASLEEDISIDILNYEEEEPDTDLGKYMIMIDKNDKETGNLIVDSSAEFGIEMVQKMPDGSKTTIDNIGTHSTQSGRIVLDNLVIPSTAGEYELILTETKAPTDYVKLNDPIIINITIGVDAQGNTYIAQATTSDTNTSVFAKRQLIYVNIANHKEFNEKDYYSLDITKIDGETNNPIEDMALFKVWLPDEQKTIVYAETSQTAKGPGKLDYCFIERDKDYSVRLSKMLKPKDEGIVEYIFREVLSPKGYRLIPKDLKLSLEFKKDANGEIYLDSATSSDKDYLRINGITTDKLQTVSVDIINNKYEDDDLYLKSKAYIIGNSKPVGYTKGDETEYKPGIEYIYKVDPKTTLTDFIKNLDTNGTPVVTKADGTPLGANELVGTNMKLTVTKGDQKIELTIAVTGDVSGEGEVTLQDYVATRQAMVGEITLNKSQTLAVDFSDDGEITLQDYVDERQLMVDLM